MNIIEKLGITPEAFARLTATAPEMLEVLIEWSLSAEAFGGKFNPSFIVSKSIIEKPTHKSWDEVKALME